jgi:hypothetical protein
MSQMKMVYVGVKVVYKRSYAEYKEYGAISYHLEHERVYLQIGPQNVVKVKAGRTL